MSDTPTRPDWSAEVERIAARAVRRPPGADDERAERDRQVQQQRADRAHERHLQQLAASVPPRYAEAATSTDLPPEVADWCRRVVAGDRSSLVLMGTVGTGKTWTAWAAFALLVRARVGRPVAVTVPAFLDGLRPGRPGTTDYDDTASAGVLLLDDLAAERTSDWTAEVLYRLIDHRWSWQLPTIITTNATGADVRARLGDRIASRLNGLGTIVTMTGPDRRDPRHRQETAR